MHLRAAVCFPLSVRAKGVEERRRPLRGLVIDDSAVSRQAITRMLETSPLIDVAGWAADGDEALRRAIELEPDFVTLDLEMPRMDGFTFLRLLMATCPLPVIVVSGRDGQSDVFKALELGAVDFVAKPRGRSSAGLGATTDSLVRKVLGLRDLKIERLQDRFSKVVPVLTSETDSLAPDARTLVIGASTGGPTALSKLLSAFTAVPSCAVLVAQHMPAGFTNGFAERLDRLTPFSVREAKTGDALEAGVVLIGKGGSHLEVQRSGARLEVRVTPEKEGDGNTPSVDRLFESAAKEIAEDLIAVVFTGMGDDGVKGARQVQSAGGWVIAESEETAVIYGMPKRVVNAGLASEVLPLHAIPSAIQRGVERRTPVAHRARGRE